jgi:hypothetical protein
VSKDDLIAEVWSGRIVSESALISRIAAVQHAIGDRGADQVHAGVVPSLTDALEAWHTVIFEAHRLVIDDAGAQAQT